MTTNTAPEKHDAPAHGSPIQKLRHALIDALDATAGVIAAPASHESITRLKNRLATLRAESDQVSDMIHDARRRISYADLLRRQPIDIFVSDVRAWTPDGVRDLALEISNHAYTARRLPDQFLAADWRALTELCNALDEAERAYTAARLLVERLRKHLQDTASSDGAPVGYVCKIGPNGPKIVPPPITTAAALVQIKDDGK